MRIVLEEEAIVQSSVRVRVRRREKINSWLPPDLVFLPKKQAVHNARHWKSHLMGKTKKKITLAIVCNCLYAPAIEREIEIMHA